MLMVKKENKMNIIKLFEKVGILRDTQVYDECNNLYIEFGDKYRENYDFLDEILESKGIDAEEYSCITADTLKELSQIDIIIPDDLIDWESVTRRPYFQLRGKEVTPEQAFEIIRRTDEKFTGYDLQDSLLLWELSTQVITDYKHEYSWIHKDGTIGINGCTGKYPNTTTLIRDSYMLLSNFPYLDFVWAIAFWDESPYDEITGERKDNITLDEFLSDIVIGVKVCNNTIKIMSKVDTQTEYKRYSRLYEKKNKKIYDTSNNFWVKVTPEDKEYFKRLAIANGLTPEDINKHL